MLVVFCARLLLTDDYDFVIANDSAGWNSDVCSGTGLVLVLLPRVLVALEPQPLDHDLRQGADAKQPLRLALGP